MPPKSMSCLGSAPLELSWTILLYYSSLYLMKSIHVLFYYSSLCLMKSAYEGGSAIFAIFAPLITARQQTKNHRGGTDNGRT